MACGLVGLGEVNTAYGLVGMGWGTLERHTYPILTYHTILFTNVAEVTRCICFTPYMVTTDSIFLFNTTKQAHYKVQAANLLKGE